MKWEYNEDLSISFSLIFAGTTISVSIQNFKFLGTVCIFFKFYT